MLVGKLKRYLEFLNTNKGPFASIVFVLIIILTFVLIFLMVGHTNTRIVIIPCLIKCILCASARTVWCGSVFTTRSPHCHLGLVN